MTDIKKPRAYQERRYRSFDGRTLYYRDYYAAGPVLLCLGGLSRNSKDFHRLATYLQQKKYRVLSPDYRGRGLSDYDPDPDNYRPETYLRDIRHLLIACNIHHFGIIGTSMGGLLAMGLGCILPGQIKTLIFNDIGPDINPAGLQRILACLSHNPRYESWPKAIDAARNMFAAIHFGEDSDREELARATFREYPDGKIGYDWDPHLLKALKNAPPMPDLWPLFRGISKIPLLVLRGEHSDILSAETLEKMARLHPKSTIATIKNIGHVPSLNESESRKLIDDFLTAHS